MAYLIYKTDKILVFATEQSENPKTGPSTQIWIMDATMHPVNSRKTGNDAQNQCQGCKLASNNGCYLTPLPLMTIWRKWTEGKVKYIKLGDPEWTRLFVNQYVRLGAYGNPSLIPLPLLKEIVRAARKTTGYFHDWHLMSPEKARDYGQYLMASCEPDNYLAAQAIGLRTFTVSNEPIDGSVSCLYVTKNLTCLECQLCDGIRNGKKTNVWIKGHGFQKQKVIEATKSI